MTFDLVQDESACQRIKTKVI